MKNKKTFTKDFTAKIAGLSYIKLNKGEEEYFTGQFNETLEAVERLNEIDTQNVHGTDNVTGLINVYREDLVDKKRVLTQEQALSNAKRIHKGFFIVKGVLDEK